MRVSIWIDLPPRDELSKWHLIQTHGGFLLFGGGGLGSALGALEPSAASVLRIRLDHVSRLGLERRAGAPEPPPKTHTTKQTRTKREKDQSKDHSKAGETSRHST